MFVHWLLFAFLFFSLKVFLDEIHPVSRKMLKGQEEKSPRLQLKRQWGLLFTLNIADPIWSFSQG